MAVGKIVGVLGNEARMIIGLRKVEYYASIRGSCCRESPTNNAHTRYVCGHLLVLAVKLRELDATRGRKRDHGQLAYAVGALR